MTSAIRFEIAFQAYEIQNKKNSYGQIIELAEKYKISTSFLYQLLARLRTLLSFTFSPKEQEKQISKKEIISKMLLLKMVGRSSVSSISQIMKYDGLKYSGVGSISQILLDVGSLLPKVQAVRLDKKKEITVVSDEIFIGTQPILISVEPKSSLILSAELGVNRKKVTWLKHIEDVGSSGDIEIVKMVTDEGTGICSGINENSISWQSDTYHSIAHRLGKWVSVLERRAYKRINLEYERKRMIISAKTQKVINHRRYEYQKAKNKTLEAIEIYEDFTYLYQYIINQMQPFYSNGNIRNKKSSEENIMVALELIKSLQNEKIDIQVTSIEKLVPNLLNYFTEAKTAIKKCKKLGIEDENITLFTLIWRWDKELIKAKKYQRRRKARNELNFYIEYAKDSLGDGYREMKNRIFNQLDNIIQASSMVENINSILRPYLNNSKNQITQKFLNLFMFYHNHRRYKAGKRKGKTPMEIFTDREQKKDWIELLTDFIEKKEPNFFH